MPRFSRVKLLLCAVFHSRMFRGVLPTLKILVYNYFMHIIRFKDKEYIPSSHEDFETPGVLKKILIKREDLINGQLQMINRARLLPGRSFNKHYHEDMEEIFIMLNGKVKIIVDNEEDYLQEGDTIIVPVGKTHQMINETDKDIYYLAIGVSTDKKGKTVRV